MSARAPAFAEQAMPNAQRRTPNALAVRDAGPRDNHALLALADACPMDGDVSLCVARAPDFFSLNRLEGDRWRVGVVEDEHGDVVGCAAIALREVWLAGARREVVYASDLKVRPDRRRRGIADVLSRWVVAQAREMGGGDVPVLLSVLAGNRPMESRTVGRAGVPDQTRVARVRAHAVPILWSRHRAAPAGWRVEHATPRDLEEMAALWTRVAPARELAPVLDADSLARFARSAPGLSLDDYLLARGRDGRIAAFMGVWDQRAFKQMRVERYSARMRRARMLVNAVAPLVGAARLPAEGGAMRSLATVHVCAAPDATGALRGLVLHAHDAHRGRDYAFLTVGLDVADPLSAELRGLLAQPTDVGLYLTTAGGPWRGGPFGARPAHFETALV